MNPIPALSFESIHMPDWPFTMSNPEPWKWTDTKFDLFQLWIVLDGTGQVWIDGIEYQLSPGTCFTYAPDADLWAQSPGGLFHHFACYFYPIVNDEITSTAKELPLNNVLIEDIGFLRDICHRATRCSELGDEAAKQQAVRYVWIILSIMWRARNTEPLTATEKAILEDSHRIKRAPENEYPIDQLAAGVSLSPSQYARIFKKMLNASPNQFHIRAKMNTARNLLRETSMEVGKVAEILGYNDLFFFSRQFKKFTKESPTEYRKKFSFKRD